MRNVDNQCKKWSNEQSPKIANNFNTKFMKFMTDNSPIRSARKLYHEQKREERRQKQVGPSEQLMNTIHSAVGSNAEISLY